MESNAVLLWRKFFSLKSLFVLVLLAFVVVAVVLWNESRKEVIYLCPNFKPGVHQSSVFRQLDTITLSSYHSIEDEGQPSFVKRVLLTSDAFNMVVCTIDIGVDGRVIRASVD